MSHRSKGSPYQTSFVPPHQGVSQLTNSKSNSSDFWTQPQHKGAKSKWKGRAKRKVFFLRQLGFLNCVALRSCKRVANSGCSTNCCDAPGGPSVNSGIYECPEYICKWTVFTYALSDSSIPLVYNSLYVFINALGLYIICRTQHRVIE